MKAGHKAPGDDEYEALWDQWSGVDAKLTGPGGRPGPEVVAAAVRRAIEDPATPLRVPVGEDAATVLTARSQLDDPSFEAVMRKTLNLTW
jgi:hypothetical protein